MAAEGDADLEDVEFFAPYCPAKHNRSFPREVKQIIDELNGQCLPLLRAMDKIQAATSGKIALDITGTCILLFLEDLHADHCWQVIHYRKARHLRSV